MVKVRPQYDDSAPIGERLIITKNGIITTLPYRYTIADDGKLSTRVQEQDKAFAHGSSAYGDGKIDSRKIKISVYVKGRTQAEYENNYNELLMAFNQRDYTLATGRTDRVYRVEAMTAVGGKYLKGFKQRWADVDITLLCTNPFRYATSPTNKNVNFVGDQTETVIEINNESSIDVPLIWSFAPPNGVTANNITIKHVESGESFTLRDTLLTAPAVSVVNAEAATIRRDGGNSINTFAGLFLHALPGVNHYQYTGAACNITIAYTRRWLM